MTEILLVFFLLGMFQIKHFVADYPLQIPYMLGKMKETGWFFPLLSHVSVHGLITGMIGLMMDDLNEKMFQTKGERNE